MRLHLDTDFAGDTDDACALAMVLGWSDVEVVGITTTADPDGQRAGYLAHVLRLVGREDIPVAAGAGVSITTGLPMGGVPDHEAYWGTLVEPRSGPPEAAVDLIARSLDLGATIAAIGPLTNLALLEQARPGRLNGARVVVSGGWVHAPEGDLPLWGPDKDWNIQCDTRAAFYVATHARLTLTPFTITLRTHLRSVHLNRLTASGSLGKLLARQAVAHGAEYGMAELGRAHTGLPGDLLNFQYDPAACAVALGWPGALVEEVRLHPVLGGDVLHFEPDDDGRRIGLVVELDGSQFAETWIACVEEAQRRR